MLFGLRERQSSPLKARSHSLWRTLGKRGTCDNGRPPYLFRTSFAVYAGRAKDVLPLPELRSSSAEGSRTSTRRNSKNYESGSGGFSETKGDCSHRRRRSGF